MSAVLSPCGTYRYSLKRSMGLFVTRKALFIMLNPSTADHEKDDPTIRRCLGFANSWGCSRLTVVNLFGLRSTDPDQLEDHPDPIGPHNDRHLFEEIDRHMGPQNFIVAAWGSHPRAAIRKALQVTLCHKGVQCLGTTKNGSPRHPLYVRADQPLIPWTEHIHK